MKLQNYLDLMDRHKDAIAGHESMAQHADRSIENWSKHVARVLQPLYDAEDRAARKTSPTG